MTIADYAKNNNMTYRQVMHRIKKKIISAKKNGKSWDILEEPTTNNIFLNKTSLSDAELALNIKIKQQKLEQEIIKTQNLKNEYYSVDDILSLLVKIMNMVCEKDKPIIQGLIENTELNR